MITICTNCKHAILPTTNLHLLNAMMGEPRCAVNRANFVYGGVLGFKACATVNTDGACRQYEPKPPKAVKQSRWKRVFGGSLIA